MMSNRAVFLDRDGTLMQDVGYPRHPDQVALLPGAAEALAACRNVGLHLAIISNQSGVGRGYFDSDAVDAVHTRLLTLLAQKGVQIDDSQYCLHAPEDGCACRKPSPLMIQRSARRLNADLAQSFMVGDKLSDIEAGHRAGCHSILLGQEDLPQDRNLKCHGARDWQAALKLILDHCCNTTTR